jgi:hypothetical protein
MFDEDEVIELLRAAVEHEGGQRAFANRHGLDRTYVNMPRRRLLRHRSWQASGSRSDSSAHALILPKEKFDRSPFAAQFLLKDVSKNLAVY